jgi:sarcosine oxidase
MLRWQTVCTENGQNVVEIVTDKATYIAKKAVFAVGPWAPQVYGESLPFPLHVVRNVLFWFKPAPPAATPFDNLPVYIWNEPTGLIYYGFPTERDGSGVKIALHDQNGVKDETCSPSSIDRTVSEDEVTSFKLAVRNMFPGLDAPLESVSTCMYTCTENQHL